MTSSPPGSTRVPTWVRTPEELARLVDVLEGSRALALDTESDSLHHHFEKVCLVQIATEAGAAYLLDPLVLRDLSPLGPVLADPGIVTVLHGADYDVSTLKRDFGFRFAGLFDTMIAARLLGFAGIGLQAVAEAELGVRLSKASQKDDWSRRPLTPVQEAYAADDVAHLLELRARLAARLEAAGRLSWLEEECAVVAELPPLSRARDSEAFKRIKGAQRLSRRSLAVLQELHAWREGVAERRDTPPFRILGNEALLHIAVSPPRGAEELGRVRGVPPRLRRQPADILGAVARGLARNEADLPEIRKPPRPVVPPEVLRRRQALRAWRAEAAKRLALDVSVVLPQRLIDRLSDAAPRDATRLAEVEGLRRWRIEAFGKDLLAAVRQA